ARRDHGLWTRGVHLGSRLGGTPAHRGGDRQQRGRVPPAGTGLLGHDGRRLRVRPRRAAPGRDRDRRRVRRRLQRRQLQHHLRPGGSRAVRGDQRGGAHLRPRPRGGVRAPGGAHGGHGDLGRRPGPASHPACGGRAVVARPVRHGARGRDLRALRLGGIDSAAAAGRHRGPGRVHHAPGLGNDPRPAHDHPRRRPVEPVPPRGAVRDGVATTSARPGRGVL
ncbi:MAG: TrkA-like protein, partial [uncultured Nocardioidaceae bacterium]